MELKEKVYLESLGCSKNLIDSEVMLGSLLQGGYAFTTDKSEAKITLIQVPDTPGVAAKLFNKLAECNVNIDMIIQNVSEHGHTDISFTMNRSEMPRLKNVLEELLKTVDAKRYSINENIAKLSVVGIGMRSHSGVASQMFSSLAKADINISMISTSEIKISCVINENDSDKATQVLHQEFQLEKLN